MPRGAHASTRRAVFERDGMRCVYCGRPVRTTVPESAPNRATVDHVRPWAAGGRASQGNLVTACFECNQAKADFTYQPPAWTPPTLADLFPT